MIEKECLFTPLSKVALVGLFGVLVGCGGSSSDNVAPPSSSNPPTAEADGGAAGDKGDGPESEGDDGHLADDDSDHDNGAADDKGDEVADGESDQGSGDQGSEDEGPGDQDPGEGSDETPVGPLPPSIAIHFPCDGCRFFTDELAVSGFAELPDYPEDVDAELEIFISAGNAASFPDVDDDGRWLAPALRLRDPNVPASGTPIIAVAQDTYYHEDDRVRIVLDDRPTFTTAVLYPGTYVDGELVRTYFMLEDFAPAPRLVWYTPEEDQV